MTGPPSPPAPPAEEPSAQSTAPAPPPADPLAALRTVAYLRVLLVAALAGIPISAAAYGYVVLFNHIQGWLYHSLPPALGFHGTPVWWPFPVLAVAGVAAGLVLRYLPGEGGHSPADGMSAAAPVPSVLIGIMLITLISLGFGIVLGPEAPLIALGGGLGLICARLLLPKANTMGQLIVPASGSFAALGTIFGSPLTAAVFLMEAIGIGGSMLTLVMVPGLLAAGVGALVFVGLGRWTGVGAASLSLPNVPAFSHPDLAQLGWCLVVGAAAALLAWGIRFGAVRLRRFTHRHLLWATPAAAIVVAGLAVAFAHASGYAPENILFSGQETIAPLISGAGTWSLGALALLLVFKSLAYSVSMSSFRGGPIFPALLVGTAGGVLAAHLPGFGLVPGIAAGMGAMTVAMLRLPIASILLPTLLLFHAGIGVTPLVIVAVVAAFVVVEQLPDPGPSVAPEPAAPAPPVAAQAATA